jgi:hypothetical protein
MTKKPNPPVNALEIFVASELKKFEFTVEDLQAKVDAYKDLTITGLDDKEGLRKVHEARMDLKNTRVAIEKTGKLLRVSANTFNKAVLGREDELINVVAPREKSLSQQEYEYEQWQEQKRMEEERQEAARLDERIKKLRAVDADHDIVALKLMPDESFEDILDEAIKAFKERKEREAREQEERLKEEERKRKERLAEDERLKKVAAEQEVENERLKKIRDEQHAKFLEMKRHEDELVEMRAKLVQQQRDHEAKLAAEVAEKKRLEDLEIARKEGEEKARREEQERKEAQQAALKLQEEQEKARKAQEAAEQPDKEKIAAIAREIGTFITNTVAPVKMKSAKYRILHTQALEMLGDVANLLSGK